jgi:RNA-directed DNA polymerase
VRLRGGQRQKNQMELAFGTGGEGETFKARTEGTESPVAKRATESPAAIERLMEEVCERNNCWQAWKRVKANQGSPGMDGTTIRQFPSYLKQHWPSIREQLLQGTYQPQPGKRVEIPKADGGVRQLGIPTVLDRLIQQAVLQVLQPRWDKTFSEHSYGFRPQRSAHQAVAQAQQYVAAGYGWVVDLDLEKFFDRVNHDRLMSALGKRVSDKRMLGLIGAYLRAGVMENGLVNPAEEGTPQGGPLSPLLSNLVLDELDRELERRGHRFVRYADDCNIYVRSRRAGERVMQSITAFLQRRLKLKVNASKSAVAQPQERKFLGFSFTPGPRVRRRVAEKAILRFKGRIRELTRRTHGIHSRGMKRLTDYVRGWRGYFGFCETPWVLRGLEQWLRRRVRAVFWKQWKHGSQRVKEMVKRGVDRDLARSTVGSSSRHGCWRLSHSRALSLALPTAYFDSLGLRLLVG